MCCFLLPRISGCLNGVLLIILSKSYGEVKEWVVEVSGSRSTLKWKVDFDCSDWLDFCGKDIVKLLKSIMAFAAASSLKPRMAGLVIALVM